MRSKRLIHLGFVVLRPPEPHKEPRICGLLATEERTVAARRQSTASPAGEEALHEVSCSTDHDSSSGHQSGRLLAIGFRTNTCGKCIKRVRELGSDEIDPDAEPGWGRIGFDGVLQRLEEARNDDVLFGLGRGDGPIDLGLSCGLALSQGLLGREPSLALCCTPLFTHALGLPSPRRRSCAVRPGPEAWPECLVQSRAAASRVP